MSNYIKIIGLFVVLSPYLIFAQNIGSFGPSEFSTNQKEVVLIAWNSKKGIERLANSKYKKDFYHMVQYFQPQINPLYCGIATTTILLNAFRSPKGKTPSQDLLEVERPQVFGGGKIPFPSYSQWTLLNEKTDNVKTRKIINLANITKQNTNDISQFDPGLTLPQLHGIQEAYQLNVKRYHADEDPEKGVITFRNHLREVLRDNTQFIIVNFIGTKIGTTTGGHISPVVAYEENSDSILILDVAGHKNPWYWVPVNDLYKSMHTKDGNKFRGWLIVSDSK